MLEKLKSRKFLMTFFTMLIGIAGDFGIPDNTLKVVYSIAMVVIPLLVYLFTQGKIDAAAAKGVSKVDADNLLKIVDSYLAEFEQNLIKNHGVSQVEANALLQLVESTLAGFEQKFISNDTASGTSADVKQVTAGLGTDSGTANSSADGQVSAASATQDASNSELTDSLGSGNTGPGTVDLSTEQAKSTDDNEVNKIVQAVVAALASQKTAS